MIRLILLLSLALSACKKSNEISSGGKSKNPNEGDTSDITKDKTGEEKEESQIDTTFYYDIDSSQCFNKKGEIGKNKNSEYIQCSDWSTKTVSVFNKEVDIRGSHFSKSEVRDIDFSTVFLEGCQFNESVLTNVKFDKTKIENANFDKATISNSDLSDMELYLSLKEKGIIFGTNNILPNELNAPTNETNLNPTIDPIVDQTPNDSQIVIDNPQIDPLINTPVTNDEITDNSEVANPPALEFISQAPSTNPDQITGNDQVGENPIVNEPSLIVPETPLVLAPVEEQKEILTEVENDPVVNEVIEEVKPVVEVVTNEEEDIVQENIDLNEEVIQFKKQLSYKKIELLKLKDLRAKLKEKMTKVTSSLQNLLNEESNLQNHFVKVSGDLNDTKKSNKNGIAKKDEVNFLKEESSDLSNEIVKLQPEKMRLSNDKEKLNNELIDLQSKISKFHKEIQVLVSNMNVISEKSDHNRKLAADVSKQKKKSKKPHKNKSNHYRQD